MSNEHVCECERVSVCVCVCVRVVCYIWPGPPCASVAREESVLVQLGFVKNLQDILGPQEDEEKEKSTQARRQQ